MKTFRFLVLLFLVIVVSQWLATPLDVFAYQVPPLPEGNLIFNPWFRSSSNPSMAGFDGWTNVLQDGIGWGPSQKELNPSPDIVVSGTCGSKQVYCGTGARWANNNESGVVTSHPGVDVYLYQVVSADSSQRRLNYFMHYVNHKLDIFEVTVYGADAQNGPWSEVWKPIVVMQDKNPPPGSAPGRQGEPWFTTDGLTTVLDRGYPYYKVELHARYPVSGTEQGDVGVKVSGIYFNAESTDDPATLATPVLVINPTVASSSGQTAAPAGDPTVAATERSRPGRVPTVETPPPTPTTASPPTAVPSPEVTQVAENPVPSVTSSEQQPVMVASAQPENPAPTPAPVVEADRPGFIEANIEVIGFVVGLLFFGLIAVIVIQFRALNRRG